MVGGCCGFREIRILGVYREFVGDSRVVESRLGYGVWEGYRFFSGFLGFFDICGFEVSGTISSYF